jgi:hypothetical protein
MRWGLSRAWFEPNKLENEERWEQGLLHGLRREWDETGRLIAEEMFEYGTRVWGKRWDEEGRLVEDFVLKESDPAFNTLQMYRTAYAKAGLRSEDQQGR